MPDFSFGGSSGGTKLTDKAKTANDYLQGTIDPSLEGKWLSPGAKAAKEAGVEFGGYYQGVPGVGTFTSDGRYIPPGSSERLPTYLPGYEQLSGYNTLWENYDQGNLSPSASQFMGSYSGMLNGDIGDGGYFGAALKGMGGGGGGMGGGGGVAAPPSFADREFNVDNIGKLTGDIFTGLPAQFQQFTLNVMNSADPSQIQGELENFTNAIMSDGQMQAEIMSRIGMDAYGAQGLGDSGMAVGAMIDVAVQSASKVNATIAQGRLTLLDQTIKKMGIAAQLQNDLLDAGATEQANRVAFENAKLQAEAQAYAAQVSAQAQIQSAMAQANASIQQQLIASSAMLEGKRLDLMGNEANNMYAENDMTNKQNTAALMLPYNIFQGQQGITKTTNPDPGTKVGGFGDLFEGLGVAKIAGLFSDRRLKENIKRIGTYKGLPVYTFSYISNGKQHTGFMADEVEQLYPHAVGEFNGYKYVNYAEII